MDQASASPEASCAHNPVAPRTSSSCSRSVDRSRTGGPPHARSGPQCEPHAAPSNRDSRPSSPAPCRLKAKGYLLPEFYSGATGRSGRFNEGLLLRRLHLVITRDDEPTVTVDNIEVAQFIYLMLHNQKIRDVIDTITSKAVLILGRFTDERKAVLDALR